MTYLELDANISKDVAALTKEVQRFVKKTLKPAGVELDGLENPADVYAKSSSLWDVFSAYRKLDLHVLDIPGQMGGMAGELGDKVKPIIVEELGYGDPGLALGLESSNLPFMLAAMSTAPELQNLARAYCKDTDAKMIGCWAVPDSGDYLDWLLSDNRESGLEESVSSIRALLENGEYVISGKISNWVANAPIATHAAVLVRIEGAARGEFDIGIAIVPLDKPGVTISEPLDRIGQRTLPKSQFSFEGAKIPEAFMVVVEDMEMLTRMLSRTNEIIAATLTGLAQAAYEEALHYAKQRVQGGVPIIDHKNVKLQIFNMFMKVETARAYNRRVAAYNAADEAVSAHHAIAAKVLAAKTAFEVASEAIAIFGGNGLTKEYPVEKMFRDANTAMVSDGENNTLSIAGAKNLIK